MRPLESLPTFVGFLTTAGTPAPAIKRLNAAAVAAMTEPGTKKKFEAQGYSVLASSPEAFGEQIKGAWERTATLMKTLKTRGVKLE